MKPDTAAEFCFTGAAAMPAFLFWLGDPGLAVMVAVPLLIAGCLASLADPGAPFRQVDPPAQPDGRHDHSGIRHSVAQRRQRTRSQG